MSSSIFNTPNQPAKGQGKAPSASAATATAGKDIDGKAPSAAATGGKDGKRSAPSTQAATAAPNGKATPNGKAPSAASTAGQDSKSKPPPAAPLAARKDGGKPPPSPGPSAPAPAPAPGAPPAALSRGEDYLTKLLIRPEILKGITSELCQVDLRNLSLASKATKRLVEYTCGNPPTQGSRYTCGASVNASTCWACGIKVCLCCANPVWGYIVPSPTGSSGEAVGLELIKDPKNIKGTRKYYLLCEDCSAESTEQLNEVRRHRLGQDSDDGTYYSIVSRYIETPSGPGSVVANSLLLEGSGSMRSEFDEFACKSRVRRGLLEWIVAFRDESRSPLDPPFDV